MLFRSESEYRKSNFIKYGRYVMDVADRYLKEGKEPDIRMLVLYTADIEKAETAFERTACSIRTEAAYLVGVPSGEWMEEARRSIAEGTIPEKVLMHLVLLPLTYKGEERKQEAIRECVELARQIPDKGQESFVLAGILTFTDKVINKETRQYIKEVLGMTQIGKMLMDEGRQAGIQEGRQAGIQEEARKNARNLLKRGTSLEEVAEILELPVETVQSWNLEACTVV